MITVGWTPYKFSHTNSGFDHELEFIHNVFFEPEKLSNIFNGVKSNFRNCPANTQFLKNFWLIRAPFDFEVTFDRKNRRAQLDKEQKWVNEFFHARWDESSDNDNLLITHGCRYLFVADEPTRIEVYPPFLHKEVENTRFINGTFDIQKWQRPVDFSFEVLDDTKPVKVKRGDPLFYIKFQGEDLFEDFKLKEIEWTDELLRMTKRCQPQVWYKGLGWKLARLGNRGRPKKLVK
jgi:hypothetical protein